MNHCPEEAPPKLTGYLTGFTLALLLTLLAFGCVILGSQAEIPRWQIISGVSALALVQILVHLHYFLHLGFGAGQKLRVIALLFSLLIVVIMVGGTLWIMHDLNAQMIDLLVRDP